MTCIACWGKGFASYDPYTKEYTPCPDCGGIATQEPARPREIWP